MVGDKKYIVTIDVDLEELIPGFIDNRHQDVAVLRQAADTGDFEVLRSIGHNLKGVGGGYGFMQITNLGAAIEQAGKNQDTDAAVRNIEELDDYLKNVEIRYE